MEKLIERIESYGFRCTGGPLHLCTEWIDLKHLLIPTTPTAIDRSPIGWGALQKPKPYRNVQYMLWVKTFPCLVRGVKIADPCSLGIEAAHTGKHGLRTKASDFRVVPLCSDHHRGSWGLDYLGPERFAERYNVNLQETALQLVEAWLAQGNTL